MATVDNGTVSAVAAGAATITATIEVEGVTYSDSCDVTVEAAPVSNVVFDFTAAENWGDPSLWYKQDYLEDTRGTYISYDNGRLYCHYNPEGSSSTLYADIAPYTGEFVYDDSFNYFLEFSYDNPGANTYKLTAAGANYSIFNHDDTWTEYMPNTQTSETVLLPLALSVESATRFITIQIRKDTATEVNPLSFTARIIREPK